MTIILDLDDVLANLRESLYQTLSSATGIDLHWRHWDHYDLRQHFDVVLEQLESILVAGRVLEICEPEPGAAVSTRALRELGCEVAIVTARGWHPQAESITRDWLAAYGIDHDHLTIVPLGADKLEVLSPFPNIILAVDDHPINVSRYESAGIPALMVDRPWNASFEGGQRIFSLDAVVEQVAVKLSAGKGITGGIGSG